MPKQKLTTSEFIDRAVKKHGQLYDYSEAVYTGSYEPVSIICHTHGIFKQKASYHLTGNGCKQCHLDHLTKDRSQFISEASAVHGGKYNYDDVVYINTKTKVCIKCSIHGQFNQTPNDHLRGHGCSECGHNVPTTLEYIDAASEVHNGYYSYDSTEYTGSNDMITVNCPVHGQFTVKPSHHLNGSGCNQCKETMRMMDGKSKFVAQACIIHGMKYNYDKVKYVGTHSPVTITCPIHGDFRQKPNSHLSGRHGCSKCSLVGGYDYNRLFTDKTLGDSQACVYLIKLEKLNLYKVGISIDVDQRVKSFNRFDSKLIAKYDTTLINAYVLEQNILHTNVHKRLTPLQTKFDGYTECLNLCADSVQEIIELFNYLNDNTSIDIKPLRDYQ